MSKEKVKKPFYKKNWVWVLAIIIVVAVASGGNGDTETASITEATSSDEIESNEAAEVTEEETEEASADVTTEKIGEAAAIGDVTFTVNGVEGMSEIDSGNEFIENATTDGKFAVLDVTVQNDKSESITIDSSYFKIVTGEGVEYDPNTDGEVMMAMSEEMDDFFLEQINPGLSKTGKIVFEVGGDIDLSTAVLKAQTGFWGTESIEISLGE